MTIHTNLPCLCENYTLGRNGKISYIVVHYIGNNGDTARGNANYFAKNAVRTSAHFFVDENEIVQSVLLGDTAWHCGAKSYRHPKCRNGNSIGIELCSKVKNGEFYIPPKTIGRAIVLVKRLMGIYGIDSEHVLRHYDVTGKLCPEPMVRHPEEWIRFKEALDDAMDNNLEKRIAALEGNGRYNYIDQNLPAWAQETVRKLCRRGVLSGNEQGELNLSEDMLRILVLHDRLGLYEERSEG